ncbi:hypothetical protein QAD02_014556 [Eretmocerus hayati]|uniref:Uncharacterized protein n=1 Tax=Eretmocerus hayati TaxID=131215 RepID=A0ACC2P838_9HYME|nr:hypothetical protein QAD02_014556 [Eretmocerus hayati]
MVRGDDVQEKPNPIRSEPEEDAAENEVHDEPVTSISSNSFNELTAVEKNNKDECNAQIDSLTPCWDSLPSVILLEIFSYLPRDSRIQASQVCRNWRYALFHPTFWKRITFSLVDHDSILWSRCLSSWFQYSVQEVTIRCESANNFAREALYVLKKLSSNRHLRKISLEPSKCMFEYPNHEVNGKKLLKQLLNILDTSNCLEVLSLGCIEELTEDLTCILKPLRRAHANHLTHLSLASVKDDPDHYAFLELQCSLFENFSKLTILTIDYEHVNNELLLALKSGVMKRFVVHVHGWDGDYVGANNEAWESFSDKNPQCELRLSLIHSYNAVRVLDSEILHPAMPLTHLKVLFCEGINVTALHQLSDWYSSTLQSLIWIDSFNSQENNLLDSLIYDDTHNPDPVVLAAWRCKNLSEIIFIGQKYSADNLRAIVRLTSRLQRLEFAENDIVYEKTCLKNDTINEIKKHMGKQWKLLKDKELPKVVINPLIGDSREVIMPLVLPDQK